MEAWLRYRTAVIGIVIGISISLLGLFLATYMRELKFFENQAIDNLSYKYQYAFSVKTNTQEDFEFVSALFQKASVTIIGEDMSLYVNEENAEHLCRIIFSQTEKMNYQLSDGRFPNEKELQSGQSIVVLGDALRSNTYSRDGKDYIRICGEEYLVTGYCADKYTTIGNYSILLFAGCLGQRTMEDVWRAGNTYTQTYSLNSNSEIDRAMYSDMQKLLEKNEIKASSLVKYQKVYNGGKYRKDYLNLSYMIFGFSMFITLIVVRFWLFQRQYEFAIRRIYGYSKLQLYGMIIKELSILFLVSLGYAMGLYGILSFGYYLLFHVQLPWMIASFLYSILMVFIIIVLEIIWVVWNTFRGESLAAYRRG